ncbi:MAG: serine/threonine-protein phosphatase [Spirochaetia bacterium]|nr:serine/threonine-protein phosphatase [Spirochaetia bacterium]
MKLGQLPGKTKVLFFAILISMPVSIAYSVFYYLEKNFLKMGASSMTLLLEIPILYYLVTRPEKYALKHMIALLVAIGPIHSMFNQLDKPGLLIWVVPYPLYLFVATGFRTGMIWNICIYIILIYGYFFHPLYEQLPDISASMMIDFALANLFVFLISGYFAFRIEKDAEEMADRSHKLNKSLQLIDQDLKFARVIQQNVILKQAKQFPGIHIASAYQPYSHVSGDFFDIAEIRPGLIRFFIADVTGHGLQAALVTMTLKSEYDFFKEKYLATDKLLENLNHSFCDKFHDTHIFATAFLVDLDLKNHSLEYTSAGHPTQFLLGNSNNDQIESLSNRGKPLGIASGNIYESSRIPISASMRLYLFTDGLTETHNELKQEFGEDRLIQEILKTRSLDVKKQVANLMQSAREFSHHNEVSDDVACIIAEIETRS